MTRGTKVGMLIADLNEQGLSIVRLRSEENPVFIYVWGSSIKMDWAKNAGHVSAIVTTGGYAR